MSAQEKEFGNKIKSYLDQEALELRSGLAFRLQQARSAALARAAGEPLREEVRGLAGAHGLAGAPGGSIAGDPRSGRPIYAQMRLWLGIGVLAAAVLGYQQWVAWQNQEELEDLDAQILTSDLPIDAYLDRGFQLWLKTSQPGE